MMSKTFYQFYGYDIEVIVGSLVINTSLKKGEFGLCDKLTITRQENSAGNANFTFIPPEQIIDLDAYQGQPVIIFFRTPQDGWQQVFTGFVDVPILDFLNRKVTFQCTDDRANQIIQLPYSLVASIGYFDQSIFGAPTDQSDELDKRLQTVTANFDFNRFGQPTLTSWTPKDTPDFDFESVDIAQNSNPSVTYTSRKKATNTVTLTFKYSYQRLHQQSINFVWPGYSDFMRDYWNEGRPSFPQRTMISSAANVGNWSLINPTLSGNFVPLWPAQGFSGGPNGVIIWQPNQVINSYAPVTKFVGYLKDSTGNFVTVGGNLVPQYTNVVDANGNKVMQVVSTTTTDTSSALCRGASWTSATKFSQNVAEIYTLNIIAPQSVDKFGTVNQNASYALTDQYDTSTWEGQMPPYDISGNFYIDQDYNRANLHNALQVAYNKAVHDILVVHRDVQVMFRTKHLQPKVDLPHTCYLNVSDPRSTTAHISAKGKVGSLTHTVDFRLETAYSEMTLLLSKADSTSTTDAFHYNVPVQNPGYIGSPQTISLPTHAGLDPTKTPGSDKWVGWICNKQVTTTTSNNITTARTNFQENFVVDYPAIPDALRNEVDYSADTTLQVAIPSDFLETST